jgi:hypothetical protein
VGVSPDSCSAALDGGGPSSPSAEHLGWSRGNSPRHPSRLQESVATDRALLRGQPHVKK